MSLLHALEAMYLHVRELHALPLAAAGGRTPGRILRLADREPRQLLAIGERRLPAKRYRVVRPVERAAGDVAHVNHDGDIVRRECLELLALVRAHQHVDRPHDHGQRRLQLLGGRNRVGHGHRNHDVGAGLAGDIDRYVPAQPAVAEHATVDDHRCEDAGDRHAGAQRMRQVSRVEHDHLAGLHVGRDGPERYWQLVEIANPETARDQQSDRLLDVLRVYEAAGRREPVVAKTEFEAIAVDVTCELPAHRLLPALALEADRLLEGNPADRGVDLGSGQPRCVGAAYQRAHARADDAIDRNAQLLEHRQHADVRGALGAAAAQRQTDAWAYGLTVRPTRHRGRRIGRGRGRQRESRNGERKAACTDTRRDRPSWTRRLNSLPGMPSSAQVACAS